MKKIEKACLGMGFLALLYTVSFWVTGVPLYLTNQIDTETLRGGAIPAIAFTVAGILGWRHKG